MGGAAGQGATAKDVAYNRVFAQRVTVEHTNRRLRVYTSLTAPDGHHRRARRRSSAASERVAA